MYINLFHSFNLCFIIQKANCQKKKWDETQEGIKKHY